MTKFRKGLAIALLMVFSVPNAFATEKVSTVDLVSQSKVWLSDRANITFTIAESSGSGISNAEVEISTSALLGRSAIRSVIAKPNILNYRKILETTDVAQTENLFNISVPGARLKFNGAGTYALRIKVYVRGEAQKLTSFISYVPKSVNLKSLKVATVLPLVVNAGLTPSNSVLNNKAADAFLEKAGLNSVLNIGKTIENVTWLLDADTLRVAQGLTENRQIVRPDIHDPSDSQAAGAISWLEKTQEVLNLSNTFAVPTGNVDAVALHIAGFNRLAKSAIADASYMGSTNANFYFKTITVAPKGDYSNTDASWLQNQGISFNLLNSSAYPSNNSTYTPNGVVRDGTGAKAPVVDLYASSLFSDAISSKSNTGMYQAAFAGDLLITALEQPSVDRFIIVMPNTNQNGITNSKFRDAISGLRAPWITMERLENFRDQPVGGRNRKDVTNRLSKVSKKLVNFVQETKHGLASLITGAIEETQLDFAIMRLANSSADNLSKSQLQKQTHKYLDRLNNAVRIMTSGSVVFPSESAKVPITVRNDLSVPIRIRILATGVPAVRVIPETVEDMQIAPGRRKSIEIPTRLIGTDTAFLQLQIVDVAGKRIGNPIAIEVSSSAYAQAAAWVIGAAFALLLLFALRNTLKRIRSSQLSSRENTEL